MSFTDIEQNTTNLIKSKDVIKTRTQENRKWTNSKETFKLGSLNW